MAACRCLTHSRAKGTKRRARTAETVNCRSTGTRLVELQDERMTMGWKLHGPKYPRCAVSLRRSRARTVAAQLHRQDLRAQGTGGALTT